MGWIFWVTGAIILIGFLIGVYKGAVKIAVSLLTMMVTLVIVVFITPYVADLISDKTPMDDMIKDEVSSTMTDAATSQLLGGDGEEGGLSEEAVRKALDAAGVSEEQMEQAGISVDDIVNGEITADDLAEYGISSSILDGAQNSDAGDAVEEAVENAEIPKDVQVQAIEQAELPDIFKTLLSANNNNEIYKELGVETFAQYVGQFLADLVVHIVSFLCSFILISIILRAVVFALDIVADLPVLGLLNRIAGGGVGILCALIIVWVIFVIITLLYITGPGKAVYEAIQNNEMLKLIYDYNPIMKLATKL